jgi:hypothetical protein
MRNFLVNLALLGLIGVVLYFIAPDIMRGVLGIYNGLGIIPVMIILVILAALPQKRRRTRQ